MFLTTIYWSPLGTIVIESDGEMLTGLRFEDGSVATFMEKQAAASADSGAGADAVFAEVRQWLDDYFGGNQPLKVPRMNPPGTDFQRHVWQMLFTIQYGQTKTYGEVARMVGCRSARAVGQAIGHNPIALVIPCHRVIAADGTLGGYAYGTERKQRLLAFETNKR